MRKFLIVTGLLFVSATVFGRDQRSVRMEGFSAINQSNNMVQVSFTKKDEGESFSSVRKSQTLTNVKEKCCELLLTAQSELKNNNWLSKDAKLLYSKLNFDDIWKQIEVVLSSGSLNGADKKYVDVRKTVTNNAKIFYKQVLGDSELGQALYKKAEEVIDSAKCIQCSNLMLIRGSFFVQGEGITCRYCSADDFLLTLVHETGHALEHFYRSIKKLPKSTKQQNEYSSTFFETLLEASNFRGKLYSQDFSLHGLRIGEIYLDLLKKNLIGEILSVYDKSTLLKLYQLFKENSSSDTAAQKKRVELDKEVDDLENNPKTKLFIDVIRDFENMGISFVPDYNGDDNQEKDITWRKCLKSLDKVHGYDDLKQFLHDADIGKGPYFNVVQTIKGASGHYLRLLIGDKEIKKIDLPSELKEINWIDVLWFANAKVQKFKLYLIRSITAAYAMKNLNLWSFLSNSMIQKFLLGFGRIVLHLGILSEERLSFLENFVDGIRSIQNIDNHTIGKYNAFRLVKDKGYLDILENGKSLSIEDVMSELTKPLNSSKLTEESAGEFLDFLKK